LQPEDKLQQYVQQGIHGVPELKKEEKQQYLGQFRERVIKVLTQEQVLDPRYVDGMIQAFQDPRSDHLYIKTSMHSTEKEEKIISLLTTKAKKVKIPFSFMDGDAYPGKIVVVLAAKEAVDEPNIQVKASSLPLDFYQNRGKTLCKNCYQEVVQKYPQYQEEFQQAGFWHRLFGYPCPISSRHTND